MSSGYLLVIALVFLVVGLKSLHKFKPVTISSLWDIGFGEVGRFSLLQAGQFFTNDSANLISFVLLINLPQGVSSVLHLTYNSMFTCMLMEKEWSDYAHDRKPLRVSSPIGDQRSTYYLQLPYAYAIPLIILSRLMHWLVSQALFLARVDTYTSTGIPNPKNNVPTCGYSCIALVFAVILGGLMLITIILMSQRKYRPGMPLAGHCSAVLSAACHPTTDDLKVATSLVMWGVVEEKDGVAHCSFSSRDVKPRREGQLMR